MREKNLAGETLEFITFAIDGAHRMRKLLDGLLAYSRAGQKKDGFDVVDINHLIKMVLSNLSTLIQEKSASITLDDFHPVIGHEITLLQLFQNIISNGIKFQKRGISPILKIDQALEKKYVKFEIADNGIGIESEYHEKAFKLFGRLNTIEKYPGSGLGLAVCKRVVENHGGKIWIESKLGVGTKVIFTLPKAKLD